MKSIYVSKQHCAEVLRSVFFALALCSTAGAFAADPAPDTQLIERARKTAVALLDRTQSAAEDLATHALSFLGIYYRRGGQSPESGFDCSGLVRHAALEALGRTLPRTARDMAGVGTEVERDELRPGDLVFFNTLRRTFSHVGIYLGGDKFVHAPSAGGVVRVEDMRESYWLSRYNGARRISMQ
ncbi:MAG: C40 family peptidase [Rhodocyclaceae bacterium]|nr:C40 family peptidase [Rhodocyclaceae bacterium]MBX3670909.1 C40 family peptidase [Rhodocyclaceae bacterium]